AAGTSTVGGRRNPGVSGVTGNFTLATKTSGGGLIDQGAAPGVTITPAPPTLSTVSQSSVDAVFGVLSFSMTGSGFVDGGTSVTLSNGRGSGSSILLAGSTFLSGNLNITGGGSSSTEN